MDNPEHRAKLLEGAKAWNEWRGENVGAESDLSKADLRWAKLSRVDLREVYLREADLVGAYLRGADLRGANLSGRTWAKQFSEMWI